MQLSSLSTIVALLAIASPAMGLPASEEVNSGLEVRQSDRGEYTVSGLGSRKQAILNAGGNTLDLALAMLETDTMTTNYAYGECTPISKPL
jgi:hypothetical protein